MKSVEASAPTRQEAIQKALSELGVELHEVEIEILDEGSPGFLGLGKRDVLVCVKAEHLLPDEKTEEQELDEKARRVAQGSADGRGTGGQRQREPRRDRGEARPTSKPTSKPKRRSERAPKPQAAQPQRSRPARPPRKERSQPVDRESADNLGKSAAALMNEIIAKMGMDGTVQNDLNEDGDIVLRVESTDSAILIGRKGRNLSAMQFLLNRMMLNSDEAETVDRIIVDVEGYIERRRESLEDMAFSLAKRAKESGRTVRVKPLNPQERRIIHLALEDDEDIRTFSLGNSLDRRVVIVPKGADDFEFREDRGRGRDHHQRVDASGAAAEESSSASDANERTDSETDES